MPHRRIIKARDVVADIRSGMGKSALLEKYRLSEKGFDKVCGQLVDAGVIEAYEIPQMRSLHCSLIKAEAIRALDRYYLDFDLPVYEDRRPETKGKVRDITLEGIGVSGLKAVVGETKKLVVPRVQVGGYEPFEFQAVCRWSKDKPVADDCQAGFEITSIAESDLQQLSRLIGMVTSGE